MKKSKTLNKIKETLEFCSKYWTILFGSFVNDDWIQERSDIDVAVITKLNNRQENLKIWSNLLAKTPANYDLRIFELIQLQV